jgi:hypothetical protein
MARRVDLLSLNTEMRFSGPLFDARGRRLFRRFREQLEEEAADFVLTHVKDTYHTHFKHPTGYYESHVRVKNTTSGPEVWDGGEFGPVYGPWLEGLGSRNATSRFKGYHAFRKAAAALDARIERMGDILFERRYQDRF